MGSGCHEPVLYERKWQKRWSIGMYGGDSPLRLAPLSDACCPTLTAQDISDVPAAFVADPFLAQEDRVWHMFFELWNRQTGKGEIGHAWCGHPWRWHYSRVVLAEPFHLSYPYIIQADNQFFMIPESRRSGEVRLYRADPFPDRWVFETTLLKGSFVDPSLFRYQDRFWMFTHAKGDTGLLLYSGRELRGPWSPHPESPFLVGDRRTVRGGGRVIDLGDRLIRLTQDSVPSYGFALRAMEIDELSPRRYCEHEITESPILKASGNGWNAAGMHHADIQPLEPGAWIAAVDGAMLAYC